VSIIDVSDELPGRCGRASRRALSAAWPKRPKRRSRAGAPWYCASGFCPNRKDAVERLDRGEARVNPDRATIDSYSWQSPVEHWARFTGLGVYARPSGGR